MKHGDQIARSDSQSPSLDFDLRVAPGGASQIVPDDYAGNRKLTRGRSPGMDSANTG